MVQDMGNTCAAILIRAAHAMESERTYANRVCVASPADEKCPRAMSEVWHQCQDRIKWMHRLLEHGLAGMAEESRRPKSNAQALDEGVVCEIVRLKEKHRNWGPRKLPDIYARLYRKAPSESSFKRVLSRAGLAEPRRLRQRREAGRLFTGRRAQAPK
jgi:hypothetical protein